MFCNCQLLNGVHRTSGYGFLEWLVANCTGHVGAGGTRQKARGGRGKGWKGIWQVLFCTARGEGGDSGWGCLGRKTCLRPSNKSISCPTLRLPGLFMLNLELFTLASKHFITCSFFGDIAVGKCEPYHQIMINSVDFCLWCFNCLNQIIIILSVLCLYWMSILWKKTQPGSLLAVRLPNSGIKTGFPLLVCTQFSLRALV